MIDKHALILALDQGTTGSTALLLDHSWKGARAGLRRVAAALPEARLGGSTTRRHLVERAGRHARPPWRRLARRPVPSPRSA
jgi:hypothetical protein